MEADVRPALRDYVVKEFARGAPIDYASPLVQQGIIDSLAIFMLIGFIEERLGVSIDPDEVTLENFESIDAMQALIASRHGK